MNLSIPGYEVFDSIGSGGMAEVYHARHLRLDRDVALKVMLPHLSRDSDFSERFLREARIAAKLNHPSIVQIYDVNRLNDVLFLSMEYVEGGDLSQYKKYPLDKNFVENVIHELAIALDYAHSKGYIHRDIKPANILFRDNGSLALSDFGIARAIHSKTHMTQTGMVVGTPSYMSPEQAQGKELTGQSDLYSLAVIAFQLVCGKLPYQSESSISVAIKHISEPIPSLPSELAMLQGFFDQALAKSPDERFANGREMAEHFSTHLKQLNALPSPKEDDATVLASSKSGDALVTTSALQSLEFDDESLSQLETEAVVPAARPPATTQAQGGPGNAGEREPSVILKTEKQPTISMVLMQINRFKVMIFEGDKKTYKWLSLALILCTGAIIFAHNKGLFNSQKLSPGQEARLAQLLIGAETDLKAKRYLLPTGNNAYEKYLAILALSPNDPVAVEGINTIVDMASRDASTAIDNGQYDIAKGYLNSLKSIPSADAKRQTLEQTLNTKQEQFDQQKLNLLSKAEMFKAHQEPDRAIDTYKELLALEPDNAKAKEGLQRIADEALKNTQSLTKQNKFSAADKRLQIAQSAAEPLANDTLEQEIQQSRQAIQQNQKSHNFNTHLKGLLNKGDLALRKQRYDSPTKNNAYYYYSQAHKASPNNKRALEGKNKVLAALNDHAEAHIDQRDIERATQYINRLKKLSPRYHTLPELDRQLRVAQRDKKRYQATQEKVKVLYQRANTYLASGRAKSADKIYRQIDKISPNDKGLKDLGRKIADSYVGLAQKEIDGRDWRDVSVWVNLGLKHVPDHKKLKEMQKYANEQMAKGRR